MSQTSEKMRRLVKKLNKQNFAVCEISRIPNVQKSTGCRIIIPYNDRGETKNNKSRGRPIKVN